MIMLALNHFFSSLKKDMLYGRKLKTRAEARTAVVEYIELFYNPKRLTQLWDINLQKNLRKITIKI